jgi:hypothetical protein
MQIALLLVEAAHSGIPTVFQAVSNSSARITLMKTFIFAACFFCTTFAFAQNGTVLNSTPAPFDESGHPQTAMQHPMAQETSLLMTSAYSYAKGEVPLSELASPIYETPLGDIARDLKREHEKTPKAVRVFEKVGTPRP